MKLKQLMDDEERAIKMSDEKFGRIISTIIIVLFLIHPTITKSMFSAFKYVEPFIYYLL